MWRIMTALVYIGPVRALVLVGVLSCESERDVVEIEYQVKLFRSPGQRTGSLWSRFGQHKSIPFWYHGEGGNW